MSDLNSKYNRLVWFDIPVADLDRAVGFYEKVLGVKVTKEQFQGFQFAVIEHQDGNGGCLVVNPDGVGKGGILVYLNVDGRIQDAVRNVDALQGKVEEPVHAIGPHGFRAIVSDSEGNRIALHSRSDD